jgi:hypothetical protein
MKNLHNLFSDEFASDILDDDIDQLYCQLVQIEPPTFLIDSIMASVIHLSQAQTQPQGQPIAEELTSSLNDLGDFLMRGKGGLTLA